MRVFGWCRPRCSIAHASTSGIGIAARAAPHSPPPRSSSPWRRDCGSLSMSIFATVFSHLFYQLCYSPSPSLPSPFPPCFILFRSVALQANSPYPPPPIIRRIRHSILSISSPAPTLLRGKCVVIYCFITLALMGGNILHPPPPLGVHRPTCSDPRLGW